MVPLAAAILSLFARRSARAQRVISVSAAAVMCGVSGFLLAEVANGTVLVSNVGGWALPYGIALVVDPLSALLLVLSSLAGLAAAVYAAGSLPAGLEQRGFYPLLQLLLTGVNGAFVAGDLFNLYVWFEVLLIASFVMLVLGRSRQELREGVEYVAINLVASALFLAGVALLYGATGALNLAELAARAPALAASGLSAPIATLFLVAFGIKAAAFPLFFWLPGAYSAPPVVIGALFAGLVTKVGVYALYRVFSLVFAAPGAFPGALLQGLAIATMIVGVLGAVAQDDVRRILAFHSISQVGYMLLGLALFTPLGVAGGVFFILHHAVVKASLFLIAGLMAREGGSFELAELGGLYERAPVLAVLFGVSAASLAGLPPFSGFWAKLLIVRSSFEAEAWIAGAVALSVGLLTLFSMTKIWLRAFWKPAPKTVAGAVEGPVGAPALGARGPTWAGVSLVAATAVLGIFPAFWVSQSTAASALLQAPSAYARAVLGEAYLESVPGAEVRPASITRSESP
jgi:multicomponent Na+:H+ antiporter subunit D